MMLNLGILIVCSVLQINIHIHSGRKFGKPEISRLSRKPNINYNNFPKLKISKIFKL